MNDTEDKIKAEADLMELDIALIDDPSLCIACYWYKKDSSNKGHYVYHKRKESQVL